MGLFIAASTIAFFALTLLIIGIALGKESRAFDKNKRAGKAEVVGYERADQSYWYQLIVRIPDLNDGKLYSCKSGKINLADYPKDTVVDVLYAPMVTAGITSVEVHLLENPPATGSKIAQGIKIVAYALFVVAAVLALIGLAALVF